MATTIGALRVELSANIAKFEAAMGKAAKNMARTQRSFERFGSRASAAGRPLSVGLTAPLVAVGALAAKSFLGFDQAMTRSLAIMGDVSDAMRDDMATAAREVGKTTSFSASEAAEAYFFLASAGLDAAQSVGALPQVASFAQAGLFDLSTATDLLTDAQSALGLTIRDDAVANMENMARVSDVLVKANTLANASVQQFSEALTNKAANAMAQLNIDIESGVAVLAAWADQGIKGSEAGERFNIVTRDLQTAARKNAEEFERFGIAVFDQAGNFRSLADIVADVEGALQGMSHEQQGATLAALGFTDRSIAATRSLIGSSEAIRGYERDLRSAGGTTQEVADKQLVGLTGAWIKLTSAVGDVLLEIGDRLRPVLERLAATITDRILPAVRGALDAFGRLSPEVQTSRILWLGFAAALGPALLAIGGVALALTPLVPLFGRIWAAAGRMSNVLVKALGHPIATAQALRARIVTLRASLTGLSLSARASAVGVKLASVAMTGLRFAIRGVIAALGPMILVFAAFEFAAWAAGALKLGDKLKRLVGITDDAANAADRADQQWAKFATTLDTMRAALDETTQQIDALTRKHERLTEQLETTTRTRNEYDVAAAASILTTREEILALEEEIETLQQLREEQAKDVQFSEFFAPLAALAAKDLEMWATASREAKTAARELGVELSVAVKMDHLTRAVHKFAETGPLTANVMREIGTQAAALGVPLEDLPPELKNIVTWLNRTAAAAAEAEQPVDDLGSGVGGLTDSVQTLVDRLRGTGAIQAAHKWAAAVDEAGGITMLTRGEQEELNRVLGTALEKYRALRQAVPPVVAALQNAALAVHEHTVLTVSAADAAQGLQTAFGRQRPILWSTSTDLNALGLTLWDVDRAAEAATAGADRLRQSFGDLTFLDTLTAQFEGFGAAIGQTFARALEGGEQWLGAIQSLGVQAGNRLGTSLSEGLGKRMTKGTGFLSQGLGAVLGKAAGMAIPLIGPVIGPLIGKLFSLGGPSEAELAGRKTAGAFRDGIIATLNEGQLAEASQAALGHWRGNERGAQFLIGVRDAYVAVGRSAAEAEAAVTRLWKAEARGPEAVKSVQRELQVVLDQAADLTARHRTIIQGLEGIRDAGPAAFDPAQLDPYLAQMQEAGLLTAAQAGELRQLADDAHTDWQAMEEAARTYGVAMKTVVDEAGNETQVLDESLLGLGHAQAKLTDEAGRLAAAWDLLTGEGARTGAAIRGMTDEAQGFVTQALEMGIALPAAMQPMIEKMIEQARLTDQNGEKLTDISQIEFAAPLTSGFDLLADKIQMLIIALGGPSGLSKAVEEMVASAGLSITDLSGEWAAMTTDMKAQFGSFEAFVEFRAMTARAGVSFDAMQSRWAAMTEAQQQRYGTFEAYVRERVLRKMARDAGLTWKTMRTDWDAMTAAQQRRYGTFDAYVRNQVLRTMAREAGLTWKDMRDEWKAMTDAQQAQYGSFADFVQARLDAIEQRDDVTTSVGVTYDDPGFAVEDQTMTVHVRYDDPGFTPSGARVSAQHGTPFRQFGRGTPAMLHGLERVMTAPEGRGIAAALGRIQQGLGAIANLSGVRALAEGGLVTRPTLALLGERGPEQVIPSDRMDELGGGGRRVEAKLDQLHQDFALLLDEFRHGLDPRRTARAWVAARALSTA